MVCIYVNQMLTWSSVYWLPMTKPLISCNGGICSKSSGEAPSSRKLSICILMKDHSCTSPKNRALFANSNQAFFTDIGFIHQTFPISADSPRMLTTLSACSSSRVSRCDGGRYERSGSPAVVRREISRFSQPIGLPHHCKTFSITIRSALGRILVPYVNYSTWSDWNFPIII